MSNKLHTFIKKKEDMANNNSTQDSIVRQSSLKFVQDYQRTIGTPLTLRELLGITNVIVDYCQQGWSKDIADKIDKIDKHLASKFEES
jgi:hypothetical protein